jgi:transcription elongation factor GreB
MSKAFTREDDATDSEMEIPRMTLPPGIPNYLTADGAARLAARLAELQEKRRQLQKDGEESNHLDALRHLSTQIQDASRILSSATVVPPPEEGTLEIRFGASVTILDKSGATEEYRIVGIDEVDFEQGAISWRSPLARTLLGKRAGQTAQLQTADGTRDLTIRSVRYRPSQPLG